MAFEMKLRLRNMVGTHDSREVAVFLSLDGRQFQSSGTVMMTFAELAALREIPALRVVLAENQDILLTDEEEEIGE